MAGDKSLKFDEIGYWSEIKLEILKEYAPAYTKIMSKQPLIKGFYYIDGFAGYGIHKSKTRDEYIPGSPLNALNVKPPFSGYYLIDLKGKKVEHLKKLTKEYSNVHIFKEDCNKILLEKIFPTIKYEQYKRALCLLDPYGLHLNWDVLLAAGKSKSIEIFLNFPVMDMNMNVFWENTEKVAPSQIKRMNAFWGDESWKEAAYRKVQGLFDVIEEKTSNKAVVNAFSDRLHKIAGFEFVPEPIPMRNSNGAVVYYLFFRKPKQNRQQNSRRYNDKISK